MVKNLFYSLQNGSFIFSSELTSLIKHPLVKKEIQIENIINYLHYDSFVGEQTPIKNVYKLKPSEYLIFNFKTNNLLKKKYWKIKYGKKKIDQSFSKEFFKLFSNSIDQHFTSDVPIALYLSGGLDSTSIATVAKKNLGFNKFKSFNLKFNDTSFDEDDLAYKVAKELDIELETFELSKKKINFKLLDLVDKLDEPISDTGYLAVGLISEFIKNKDYKVVLSGDGGDELFGGYEPFLKFNFFDYIKNNRPILFFLRMINSLNFRESFRYMGLSYKFRVFMRGFESNDNFYNSRWLSSFLPSEINNLINYSEVKLEYKNHDIYFFVKELTSNFETDLEKLFIQYQRHYLPNLICSHTDKANMKNSIEARSPFLNKDLFEYVNNFDRYELTTKFKSKKILREFLKKNNMNFIADAKKKGFTIPLASWINDIMLNDIKDLFGDEFKNSFTFINYDYFQKVIEEHTNKKK